MNEKEDALTIAMIDSIQTLCTLLRSRNKLAGPVRDSLNGLAISEDFQAFEDALTTSYKQHMRVGGFHTGPGGGT